MTNFTPHDLATLKRVLFDNFLYLHVIIMHWLNIIMAFNSLCAECVTFVIIQTTLGVILQHWNTWTFSHLTQIF